MNVANGFLGRILYIGLGAEEAELATCLLERGFSVLTARETLQALGAYYVQAPDVVIVESSEESYNLAQQVYFHLSCVEARPIVVLASKNNWDLWRGLVGPTDMLLCDNVDKDVLLNATIQLVSTVPSAFNTL